MNIDTIFNNLNKWIDQNTNNPKYRYLQSDATIPKEIVNKPIESVQENKHILQQEETEIRKFVEILLCLPEKNSALEIGLGKYGGTHILWKEIFKQVTTIDFNGHRIKDFLNRNNLDNTSKIICADSNDKNTLNLIPLKKYDFLFLDGDHVYESIKKDFLNYSPLIKKGGIIAFHDILSEYYGVKQFLNDLSNGKIDGTNHKIYRIENSLVMGIGYLYV